VVLGALPALFILKYLKYPPDYGKKGEGSDE
jgi:PAT family beta-lactamase induction signal transducer AmpG